MDKNKVTDPLQHYNELLQRQQELSENIYVLEKAEVIFKNPINFCVYFNVVY